MSQWQKKSNKKSLALNEKEERILIRPTSYKLVPWCVHGLIHIFIEN